MHGPLDAAGCLVPLAGGHDGAEHADVEEVAAHPGAGFALVCGPVLGGVGPFVLGVEGDAGFHIDLVAGLVLVAVDQGDRVADLPLDGDVGDQALAGDRVGAGDAAVVRVSVGVAVGGVDEEDEVVLAGRVEVRLGHVGPFSGGCQLWVVSVEGVAVRRWVMAETGG